MRFMMKVLLFLVVAVLASAQATDEKKVVCYWGSWSFYRKGNGQFDLSYVDPKLCTHMIYTFIGLSPNGQVKLLDEWNDLPKDGGNNNIARFNKLREQNPKLKTMIAIGGWNEGSKEYSRVVADPNLRRTFVESATAFVKKYKFDGFDVDWEYPAQREDSSPADKENYILLLKELRESLDRDGLLLSAAVAAAEPSASKSYNIREMSKYLHFINIMTYDFHGKWDKNLKTGMNAALYASPSESGNDAKLNVDAAVKYWLSQGAPSEKIILGIPLYGRSYTLSNSQSHDIGSQFSSGGTGGQHTGESGMLGYNEICEKVKNDNWNVQYDDKRVGAYAYKGNQWVSYDDERVVKEKTNYIKKYNLGGAMVWSIETDDFRGICGKKWPLLNILRSELNNVGSYDPQYPSENNENKEESESTTQDSQSEINNSQEENTTIQPDQPPSFGKVCKTEGYMRDPQDCRYFYYCLPYNGDYIEYLYKCPETLLYDAAMKTCRRKENVKC